MVYSAAESHLISRDTVLAAVIKNYAPLPTRPDRSGDYFASLSRSIVGQQVSTHAAAAIFSRLQFVTLLDPVKVSLLSEADAKFVGLSRQKQRYLKSLAAYFVAQSGIFDHLDELSDDAVIEELTKVAGIGVWTAQMFLMLSLRRPDIFAPSDRGLQLAIQKHFGADESWRPKDYDKLALTWRPYRTTASLYLWESLQNQPN